MRKASGAYEHTSFVISTDVNPNDIIRVLRLSEKHPIVPADVGVVGSSAWVVVVV